MPEVLAPCGLDCSECPAYHAAERLTAEARASHAAQWSTEEFPLTAADFDCDGCGAPETQVISFCAACDIRQCARARAVRTCADCGDYACAKLGKIAPEQKARLEALRAER